MVTMNSWMRIGVNSLDERDRTPGVLRSETRLNWFGGP